MTDSNKLTRRDFTVSSALALLSSVAITITGCGDSTDTPTTPASTTPTTRAPTSTTTPAPTTTTTSAPTTTTTPAPTSTTTPAPTTTTTPAPTTTTTPAPTTTTTPAPTPSDVTGTVGTNHGHTAVVTAAQLTSDTTVILDITGVSSHPHTVELTPVDLDQIAAGRRVTKTSSTQAAHAHTVTFN